MRTTRCIASVGLVLIAASCTRQPSVTVEREFPHLEGPYLGQEPPGIVGSLFAPGVVSTGMSELNCVFLPGGKEVFFSLHRQGMDFVLVHVKEAGGGWTRPEIAPFSGEYSDVDPAVSPDGRRVYFCSNRPLEEGQPRKDFDIWYVQRTDFGWSAPVNAGAPINSEANEFYPSFTRDGTMYFQSWREGGVGLADIYRAELVDGRYDDAECLPETINSPGFEGDAFIAPDESYLIVSCVRKDTLGQADLYISFRSENGSWSPLENMGDAVNSTAGEDCPNLSPSGEYLFYTSRRYKDSHPTYASIWKGWTEPGNGLGDIYWVRADVIEPMRPGR